MRRWQQAEDDRLRVLYLAGAPLAAIARELGRSEAAVEARRRAMALESRRPAPRRWSPLADALLREGTAAGLPATTLAARLRRPVVQVHRRRRELGLVRPAARRYTSADDAALRLAWSSGTDIDLVGRRLGRSPDALRLRARNLGLHRPAPRYQWSAAEDTTLRDGYADGLTCDEIARALPQRTATAVAARARNLGLATYGRRWTMADDLRLRRLLELRAVDDAARLLGRTPEGVRRRARRLGLSVNPARAGTRAGARWSAEEDRLLALHPAANPAVLANLLGRSDHAVAARLRRLGLRAGRERSPHHPSVTNGGLTPGERAVVARELRSGGSRALLRLEHRLQRPAAAIRAAARGGDPLRRAS